MESCRSGWLSELYYSLQASTSQDDKAQNCRCRTHRRAVAAVQVKIVSSSRTILSLLHLVKRCALVLLLTTANPDVQVWQTSKIGADFRGADLTAEANMQDQHPERGCSVHVSCI